MPAGTPQQTAEDAFENAVCDATLVIEQITAALNSPPAGAIHWGHVGSMNALVVSLRDALESARPFQSEAPRPVEATDLLPRGGVQ